jgi:hypothetical protein
MLEKWSARSVRSSSSSRSRFGLSGSGSIENGVSATVRCSTLPSTASCEGCDVVKIRIGELVSGSRVRTRATVTQQKTGRPVQFELLEAARCSLQAWLEHRGGTLEDYAFPSRTDHASHIGTRQYARLVDEWVTAIGLRREDYGTHSLRRTKASIIYKATGNLRAVQLLLGHLKIDYLPRGTMSRLAIRPNPIRIGGCAAET